MWRDGHLRPSQPLMFAMRGQRQRPYLREWRRFRSEMTQADLAEKAGVTQGLISQLENDRTDWSGEVLQALSDALDCHPSDLLSRDPFDDDPLWIMVEKLRGADYATRALAARLTATLTEKAS